jgi:hypothetical protein
MAGSIWAIGRVILWTNSGFIPGKMEGCTRDSIKKTKSTDTEFIHGPTRRSMQAGGAEANSMDLGFLFPKKGKERWASGKTERSSNGLPLRRAAKSKWARLTLNHYLSKEKKATPNLESSPGNSSLLSNFTKPE